MDFLNIPLLNQILVLTIVSVACILGISVFRHSEDKHLGKIFLALTISIIAWVLFAYLGFYASSTGMAVIFYRLNFAAVMAFLTIAFFFVKNFPEPTRVSSVLSASIFLMGFIFAILSALTGLIIQSSSLASWGAEIIFGNGKHYYYGAAIVITFIALLITFKKYYRLTSPEKFRVQYVILGISLFAASNIIFNVAIPLVFNGIQLSLIGDYSIIIFLIFTATAIIKHQLFHIKYVLTQTLIVILSLLLLLQIIGSTAVFEYVWKSILFVGFIILGYLLNKSIIREFRYQQELKQKITDATAALAEKNRNLSTLQKISFSISTDLDLAHTCQTIVDSITADLSYPGGALALVTPDGKRIEVQAVSTVPALETLSRALKRPLHGIGQDLNIDAKEINFTTRCALEKREQIGPSLAAFISPPVPHRLADLTQKTARAEAVVAMPIIVKNKVLGVLLFGLAKATDELGEEELLLMRTFTAQAGLAISNAQLFAEQQQFSAKLKSEVAKATHDLRAANENLRKLDQAKSEFISIASHQLRTPLTAIKGFSSMLLEGSFGKLTKIQADPLAKIMESSNRLVQIVNDVLNISRMEMDRLRLAVDKQDFAALAKGVIEEFKYNADHKQLKLEFTVKGKPRPIQCDRDLIRQVMLNYVDNAIKYTHAGTIKSELLFAKDKIIFTVNDHGIGISKEEKSQLFEKFFRSPEAVKIRPDGTGIGLFIARRIIEEHGGKVWVESPGVGKGSTFGFELRG